MSVGVSEVTELVVKLDIRLTAEELEKARTALYEATQNRPDHPILALLYKNIAQAAEGVDL